MVRTSSFAPSAIRRRVLHIISQQKPVERKRLRPDTGLTRELGFDLLDVVDIILAVERCFHITIPDEVPLVTVGDFVTYVTTHAPTQRRA